MSWEGAESGFREEVDYRVKMSLVTAAMENLSRSLRQSWSIKAVLPEPTGLPLRKEDGQL